MGAIKRIIEDFIMNDVTEKTTTADGVTFDADGVIVNNDKQVAEFLSDDDIVFNYRVNCDKNVGKVLVESSETRAASIANSLGAHELIFTFVAFKQINVENGYSLMSSKFAKEREWGHIIGIDSNGIIFSSHVKTYALSAFQELIKGFIYDVKTKKATGTLVGRLMKLNMGLVTEVNNNKYFQPKVEMLDGVSDFSAKAIEIAGLYKNGKLNYTPAQMVKL